MKKKNEPKKTYEYKIDGDPVEESEKQGGGSRLAVTHWIIDGKPTQKVLERRGWWKVETGNKMDKAHGLNKYDLLLTLRNLNKIAPNLEISQSELESAVAEGLGAELVAEGGNDPWKLEK
jgi:hypothetical protein